MRYVIFLVFLVGCIGGKSETAPAYNPDKPVFQKKGIFGYTPVTIKDIDWKTLHQMRMSSRGCKMIWFGAIALALGIAASCSLHNPLADSIGSFVGYAGLSLMVIGMIMMKVVEAWAWIGVVLLVVVIISLVVYYRDRGLKIPSLKKLDFKGKKQESDLNS